MLNSYFFPVTVVSLQPYEVLLLLINEVYVIIRFLCCDVATLRTEYYLTLWCPLLSYGYSYKNPVQHRVRPSYVIFDIRALRCSALSISVPGCQKLHMTTVGVKGLKDRLLMWLRVILIIPEYNTFPLSSCCSFISTAECRPVHCCCMACESAECNSAWLCGLALMPMCKNHLQNSEVALRRAGLVLGWVTIYRYLTRQPSHSSTVRCSE